MNALCLVLEGENIALLTIVKDYRDGPPKGPFFGNFFLSSRRDMFAMGF